MLQTARFEFYCAPDKLAEYCDDRVCVCVCVCVFVCPLTYLRNYTSLPILCMLPMAGARSLLWRRRDMLCTSGFVDDVVLAHRPRQLNVAAQLIEAALDLAINGA